MLPRRSGRLRQLATPRRQASPGAEDTDPDEHEPQSEDEREDGEHGEYDESEGSEQGSNDSYHYQGRRGTRVLYNEEGVSFESPAIQDGGHEDSEEEPTISQDDRDPIPFNMNRITKLEKNMGSIKKDLGLLLSRFDNNSAVHNNTHADRRSQSHNRMDSHTPRRLEVDRRTRSVSFERRPQRTQRPQPPSSLVRRPGNTRYFEDEFDREEYQPQHSHGKNIFIADIHSSGLMPKPFMYIENVAATTIKQKLELRPSISYLDYLDGFVALLRDPRAYNPDDLPYILMHLQDVIRDIRDRNWNYVRTWSQLTWDAIESGTKIWADIQLIQNERFRHVGGGPSGSQAISGAAHSQGTSRRGEHSARRMEFSCKQFNSYKGCSHQGPHTDNGIRLLHICSFCEASGKRFPHNVMECENKMRFHGGAHNNDQRRQHTPRAPSAFIDLSKNE